MLIAFSSTTMQNKVDNAKNKQNTGQNPSYNFRSRTTRKIIKYSWCHTTIKKITLLNAEDTTTNERLKKSEMLKNKLNLELSSKHNDSEQTAFITMLRHEDRRENKKEPKSEQIFNRHKDDSSYTKPNNHQPSLTSIIPSNNVQNFYHFHTCPWTFSFAHCYMIFY